MIHTPLHRYDEPSADYALKLNQLETKKLILQSQPESDEQQAELRLLQLAINFLKDDL